MDPLDRASAQIFKARGDIAYWTLRVERNPKDEYATEQLRFAEFRLEQAYAERRAARESLYAQTA